MAGNYFYDPRPFYGLNMSHNLIPLDELFHGRYEPVPYWMDQRMGAPAMPSFQDYHSGHKQMVSRMPAEQYVHRDDSFMAYKRPEVRDDSYTDFYRRPGPHFSGFGSMHPEMQQRQLRAWQSQDDTFLHAMAPYAKAQPQGMPMGMPMPVPMIPQFGYGDEQNRQMVMPMIPQRGYGDEQHRQMMVPMGHMINRNVPNSNGGGQYQQMEMPTSQMPIKNFSNDNGGEQYRQMEVSNQANKNVANGSTGNYSHNNNSSGHNNNINSNGHNNNNNSNGHSNNGNKQMTGSSNQQSSNGHNGQCELHGKPQGQGGKSMNANGVTTKNGNGNGNGNTKQQQRYTNDDSSSDEDSDDEYENRNHGGKSVTKNSVKSGNGHQNHSAQKGETVSHHKNCDNNQNTSSKKSGGQGKNSSSQQSYGGNNSMVSFDSSNGKKQSGQKNGTQSKSGAKSHYHDGGESSEDDDDSHANYSKKASKLGQHQTQGNAKVQQSHSHGGKEQSSYGHGQQIVKHVQYSSNAVELKVPICCDNCERKVRACLKHMDGVESVLCDQWQRKVTVFGNVKAENVLKRVKKVKKTSELWQHQQHAKPRSY